MLQKMRENAQGWAAKVVIGLLILTMALFGFGAFDFFSQADPVVASVDGHDIEESKLAIEVERHASASSRSSGQTRIRTSSTRQCCAIRCWTVSSTARCCSPRQTTWVLRYRRRS